MKKATPGICPRKKCTKFQTNRLSFGLSRLPQSFWDIHTHTQTFSDYSSTKVENIMQSTTPDIFGSETCVDTKTSLNHYSSQAISTTVTTRSSQVVEGSELLSSSSSLILSNVFLFLQPTGPA